MAGLRLTTELPRVSRDETKAAEITSKSHKLNLQKVATLRNNTPQCLLQVGLQRFVGIIDDVEYNK